MRRGVAIALVLLASAAIASYLICRPQTKRVGKTISNIKWSECEKTGSNYVEVQSVEVLGTFDIGTEVTIIMHGIVKTPFLAGSMDGIVKYGFLTVFSENVPWNPPRQYEVGPVDQGKSTIIEQNLPNGQYSAITRLRDVSGTMLQCVQATYKLS